MKVKKVVKTVGRIAGRSALVTGIAAIAWTPAGYITAGSLVAAALIAGRRKKSMRALGVNR